jgi:hypothetical protein
MKELFQCTDIIARIRVSPLVARTKKPCRFSHGRSRGPDNHQPLTLPRAAHVVAPLRLWYRTHPGEVRPGKGGLVVGLRHRPALAEALASALATARANGRLPPE